MQTKTIEEVLYKLGEWGYTELGYNGFDCDGKHTGSFNFHVPKEKDVRLVYDPELRKFGLETNKTVLNFDTTYIDLLCREIKQVSMEASMLNCIIRNREEML